MEMSSPPDDKFKVMVIKMLTTIRRIMEEHSETEKNISTKQKSQS